MTELAPHPAPMPEEVLRYECHKCETVCVPQLLYWSPEVNNWTCRDCHPHDQPAFYAESLLAYVNRCFI